MSLYINRSRHTLGVVVLLAAILVPALTQAASMDDELRARYSGEYNRPTSIPFPASNAHTEAREKLGRTLFFDPRLSESRFISCASCHNPAFSWGDGMATGTGHGMQKLGRRTPTILNLAWAETFMWDGRFDSLEAQALGPIAADVEMNMPLDKMIERLEALPEYEPLFAAAYPGESLTPGLVGKAIATFERTVVSGQAPFDRWLEGDDGAISNSAKRGFVVFNEKANCVACHTGWRFTDDSFYDIGLPGSDMGRGNEIPGVEVLEHAFKTPTLRNVDRRGPYMHDGSEKTLADAIDVYDRGGRVARGSKTSLVKPLGLSAEEKSDLATFLRTLTSDDEQIAVPAAPM